MLYAFHTVYHVGDICEVLDLAVYLLDNNLFFILIAVCLVTCTVAETYALDIGVLVTEKLLW